MSYTDVDRLILNRWTEVLALREAFEELLERMMFTVEGAIKKAQRWADEKGLRAEFDSKAPTFDIWKPEWAKRRNEPATYFRVGGFAPREFGRVDDDHPWLWLMTQDAPGFRFNEDGRVQFARQLRTELGQSIGHWDHPDAIEAEEPLGRYCTEITEADRLRWMSQPDELTAFLVRSTEEVMSIAPVIDVALGKFRKASGIAGV